MHTITLNQTDFCWQQSPSPIKIKYLSYAQGKTALDIGAGMGFYAKALRQRGFHVTGVDLFPSKHHRNWVVQSRITDLPFGVPFDTVMAFDVLEHEPNELPALLELRRLTAQRLILSVPNADHTKLASYNLTYKHHTDKTHQREYLLDELEQKLKRVGFDILKIQKEGPVHPAFFSEFVPGSVLKVLTRISIKILHRMHLLYNPDLMADIYVVAKPRDIT